MDKTKSKVRSWGSLLLIAIMILGLGLGISVSHDIAIEREVEGATSIEYSILGFGDLGPVLVGMTNIIFSVADQVTAVDGKVSTLSMDVATMAGTLGEVKTTVEGINNSDVLAAITALETRLTAIETQLNSLSAASNEALETKLDTVNLNLRRHHHSMVGKHQ